MTTITRQARESLHPRLRVAGKRRVGDPYDRSFVERMHRLVAGEEALEHHRAVLADVRRQWEQDADRIIVPFGLDWRDLDPALVDLLSWTVIDGEHWRWTGRTNNKNLPVMRTRTKQTPNTEWSAHRWLHRLLAPDHEPPGSMHPRCDAPFLCVRPAHRCPKCAS